MRKINLVFSLIFLILIFSFSSISSLTTLKPATLNQNYTLLQSCVDATYINVSISNTNGILNTNVPMVKDGAVWYYTLVPTEIGRFDVSYISDGCEGSGTSYFEVTWTGLSEAQERSRLFWIYAAAILLYIVFVIMAWKVELTWLGFLAGMFLILPGVNIMIHGFGFEDQVLIRGIATILISIGALTMVIFAFEYNQFFGLKGMFNDNDNDSGSKEDDYDYYKSEE